jgi:hypothetical protein
MAIFINKVDHVEGDYTYVDMYYFNIIIGCVLSSLLGVARVGALLKFSVRTCLHSGWCCVLFCLHTYILVEHNLVSSLG